MRELKFRAWDKKEGRMIVPDTIILNNGDFYGLEVCDRSAKSPEMKHYSMGSVKLMQHTGLLDRNGKEIYARDIDKEWGEIFWCNDHCGWGLRHLPIIQCHHCEGNIPWSEYAFEMERQIIGNTHENPELLEAQK